MILVKGWERLFSRPAPIAGSADAVNALPITVSAACQESCYYVDTRIADDAPRTGVLVDSVDLQLPKKDNQQQVDNAEGAIMTANPRLEDQQPY